MNATELEQAIIPRLQAVIDPETGVDVWRMRLIENLRISDTGEEEEEIGCVVRQRLR